jgi:hypothetical protein
MTWKDWRTALQAMLFSFATEHVVTAVRRIGKLLELREMVDFQCIAI